jgi:hypothetical protein
MDDPHVILARRMSVVVACTVAVRHLGATVASILVVCQATAAGLHAANTTACIRAHRVFPGGRATSWLVDRFLLGSAALGLRYRWLRQSPGDERRPAAGPGAGLHEPVRRRRELCQPTGAID